MSETVGEIIPIHNEDLLLDREDPLDMLVIQYKNAIEHDAILTESQSKRLVARYRSGDAEAARMLIRGHRGLVAAVALPYKADISSRDLLLTGSSALFEAAKTYDFGSETDFADHSINTIRSVLTASYGQAEQEPGEDEPMATLIMSLKHAREPKNAQERLSIMSARSERGAFSLSKLNSNELKVLPVLHLPGQEASDRSGLPVSYIRFTTSKIKQLLKAENREQVALELLRRGVRFDLPAPPAMENLSLRERQVAGRLHKRNPDIANELGLTEKKVVRDVQSLLRKTGARTRTEIALMARVYGFEPTAAELSAKRPEALRSFSEFQIPILIKLNLPTEQIAEELGLPLDAVHSAINRAARKAGAATRTELALQLNDRGLDFELVKPKRPIREVLTERELHLAKSLAKSNAQLAAELGVTESRIGGMIYYAKNKIGARSRIELALMAQQHRPDDVRPIYHNVRPRQERLFQALGIEPTSLDNIKPLLEHATPRQAEFIEAYYLSEQELSWRAIARHFSVQREAAIQTASRGLARIRGALSESEKAA